MERWKELAQNFGFKILLPRFCLYGLVPSVILLGPGGIAWLVYWSHTFDWVVVTLSSVLFLLNVTANLAISRFLRLHQTAASPYEYRDEYDEYGLYTYTRYFRVVIKDRSAFRHYMKTVRAEHKGAAIRLWLRLDDLWLVPGVILIVLGLLGTGVVWLLHHFRVRRKLTPM